ncbi:MAG: MBOAT family protein [Clostridia bacterium]|nr:MBOAT family protein [Clostridia bacterium]
MVFSSPTFLFIFLPIVFILNFAFAGRVRVRNALLLLASVVFYAWGEPVYVLLMIFTSLVNHLLALCLGGRARKKALLALIIIWNIGSLVYFKYTDFLIQSVNSLAGLSIPPVGIKLPIGISFFTFQAMSYALDVYRGQVPPQRNFFNTLLYISLFPQLIAGPIVKYHDVAAQLEERPLSIEGAASGLRRFSCGLCKKVLIANVLGQLADSIYALDTASINAPIAWLGAISYLFQIYFDFSGYSDMAIGLGRVFGFSFRENFRYPYAADSMQDFWRRWHISLSTWFKEYVYIPLGGNRRGTVRTGVNKVLVFFLTGLWHGASWNFVLWGLFHGAFLMLESYGILRVNKWKKPLRRIYTLLAVTVGFVLFRAETLSAAWGMICKMFAGWQFGAEHAARLSMLLSPIAIAALIAGAFAALPYGGRLAERLARKGGAYEGLVYIAGFIGFVLCALCLSTSAYNPFIYFRF